MGLGVIFDGVVDSRLRGNDSLRCWWGFGVMFDGGCGFPPTRE